MMDREKILARIRKLKQMTTANGCTEGEAMAAAQKLGDLLTEHNITMAEANMAEEKQELADRGIKIGAPQKGTTIKNREAMIAGVDAGDRVNITTGIGSTGTAHKQITA